MILTKSAKVRLKVLSPALAWIFYRLELFHSQKLARQPENLTITSINDGVHSPNSRHYTDEAIDIRTHNFESTEQKRIFASRLEEYLGVTKFRVLLENVGQSNEHIHVQVRKGETFNG